MGWPSGSKQEARGDSTVAAILTWILPGAGHLYLGMPLFGLIAFLLVEGLYLVGLRLSDGMLFEYLEPDLRSNLAGALTPEVGNLGALVYHMKAYGYGTGNMRVWPELMWLGCWLTACSGILNVCLMVRAHSDARAPKQHESSGAFGRVAVDVLAAWAVPGLGHWLQGRRRRALAFLCLLGGMLLLGTLLAQGSNLSRERHFYYWAGQSLAGLPALLLQVVAGRGLVQGDIPYADAGLDLACLAGLLNVLAMIDAYTYAEKRALEAPAEPDPAPVPLQGGSS